MDLIVQIKRETKAYLIGAIAGVSLVVLGEIFLRNFGDTIVQWTVAEVTGWRHVIVVTAWFFARYLAILSPVIIGLCVLAARLLARRRPSNAPA